MTFRVLASQESSQIGLFTILFQIQVIKSLLFCPNLVGTLTSLLRKFATAHIVKRTRIFLQIHTHSWILPVPGTFRAKKVQRDRARAGKWGQCCGSRASTHIPWSSGHRWCTSSESSGSSSTILMCVRTTSSKSSTLSDSPPRPTFAMS